MAEPIDEKYRASMKALAHAIDKLLNGDLEPKQVGFVLLMFDFDRAPTSERMNYMSNAGRDGVISALKELLARWESRFVEDVSDQLQ